MAEEFAARRVSEHGSLTNNVDLKDGIRGGEGGRGGIDKLGRVCVWGGGVGVGGGVGGSGVVQ